MTTYINLNKVAYINHYWQTSDGVYQRLTKPDWITVHGSAFHPYEAAPYLTDYPAETMLERARRLGIIDTWIPWIEVHFTANKTLRFSGEKAEGIWKAWKAKLFTKKKKEN